jgi:hypothetical protein
MPRRLPARLAAGALGLAALTGAVGACSKEHGSPEALCSVLGDGRAYTALFEQGFDPTDSQRALAQVQAARVDLDQLRDAAPADVRDDLDKEMAYLDAVKGVIERVDPDDPAAVVAGINDLSDERSAAQVASLELRSFEQVHCHATGSSTTSSTSATG